MGSIEEPIPGDHGDSLHSGGSELRENGALHGGVPKPYENALEPREKEALYKSALEPRGSKARRENGALHGGVPKPRESALEPRGSEAQTRRRVEAMLGPQGEPSEPELEEVLDLKAIQLLMEDFNRLLDMPAAVIDPSGKVLVAVGWQDICTAFHRVHPEARKHCVESDTVLTTGIKPGETRLYRCENGLWDAATPVVAGGRHVGNLFIGQFLFADQEVDREAFRARARLFGFDETDYMAALERVPRWNRGEVEAIMGFYARLATMISSLGHSRLILARTLAQKERLLDELAGREAQLKDFLDVAAHELRHPAALMKGYARTLGEYGKGMDEEGREESLAAIELGADRLMRVVEELLDASRIEREKFEISREQVEVEPLITRAVAEMISRGEENHFRLDIAGGVGGAFIDPERFVRLLIILLDNAVKYSPRGSPVEVAAEVEDGDLVVSVMDRGDGIAEDYAERLFDRFYQAQEARHHSTSGLGLGLYIGSRIARAHGGRLFCKPREGGGSVFTLRIPRGSSPAS